VQDVICQLFENYGMLVVLPSERFFKN